MSTTQKPKCCVTLKAGKQRFSPEPLNDFIGLVHHEAERHRRDDSGDWPEFGQLHPFCPAEQAQGYYELVSTLSEWLIDVTGYDAMSMQPNSGAQGEYAGLLAIQKYHESRGDGHRDICLIPSSAHGTNPASAQMMNMKVVVVDCDKHGNVDMDDLKAKAEEAGDNLSCIMVTYPSTHGVYEEGIKDICDWFTAMVVRFTWTAPT